MSLFPYPEYKDSGVEWLGRVPSHWEIKRIKRLVATLEQGWSPQCEGFPVQSADEWGVLKVGCVNGGVFRPDENKALPPELEPVPTLGLAAEDLLISRANTRELVGGAAIATRAYPRLMLCDKLYRIRLHPDVCAPTYLVLYLGTVQVRGQIELSATGASSSMLNIGQSTILELDAPVPPLAEQIEIAAFLDRETAKIDALVAEQEKLIALLQEKRQAVISHAVTKGLDPNVVMKDSGVEWLGEVPVHWAVTPLGVLADQIQTGPFGSQLHSSDYIDDGTPVINPSNIQAGKLIPDLSCTVDSDIVERLSQHKLKLGDIVFGRRGEMGRCAKVTYEAVGWLCGTGSLNVRLSSQVTPSFVSTYLGTDYVRELLQLESVGSTMDNLNTQILAGVPVPTPPLQEQQLISQFLAGQTAKFDTLTTEAQRAIDRLQERRTVLISAAVTGQIDVRGLVSVFDATESIAASACAVSAGG